MGKYAKIGLAVIVIVAMCWSGLWLVGRGVAEHRMKVEVARIESAGWTLVWNQSRLTGFPLGYRVTMDQVAATQTSTGLLVRLPHVVATADILDPARIAVQLPESFSAAFPIPETDRRGSSRLPPVVTLRGAASEFKAIASAPVDNVRALDVTAAGFSLVVDQEDYAYKFGLVLEGVEGAARLATERAEHNLVAQSVDLKIDNPGSERGVVKLGLNANQFSSTISTDLSSFGDLATMIYQGEPGTVDLAYGAGSIRGEITVDDGDENGAAATDGSLTLSAGSGTGVLAAEAGAIDLRTELRESTWTLTPLDDASPYRGAVTADAAQFKYQVPMAPSKNPKPGAIRLAFVDLAPDDALWTLLDPDASLKHDPAKLVLDLDMTMRVTDRIDQLLPGAPPPYEVSNVIVNEAAVEALGASASASGDLEILQPINHPLGALNVKMSGTQALIEALSAAGVLTPDMRVTAEAMLEVYAMPAEGEDHWQTEVTLGNDGISVNGLKVELGANPSQF